jgi:uncharacterized protein (TIGR02996 family)
MSPDEDAFLAAIRKNPGDDLLRLVCVDWLEEHDEPRGDLLRAEVAVAQAVIRLDHELDAFEWWKRLAPGYGIRLLSCDTRSVHFEKLVGLTRRYQLHLASRTLDRDGALEALRDLPKPIRDNQWAPDAMSIFGEFRRTGAYVTLDADCREARRYLDEWGADPGPRAELLRAELALARAVIGLEDWTSDEAEWLEAVRPRINLTLVALDVEQLAAEASPRFRASVWPLFL